MEYKEGDIVTIKFAEEMFPRAAGIVMYVDDFIKREPIHYFILFTDTPYAFDAAINVKAYDPLNNDRPFPFLIGCENSIRENLEKKLNENDEIKYLAWVSEEQIETFDSLSYCLTKLENETSNQ